ncbi:MAG: polysaccharide biosynthesis/export family protein [Acidobacteriota bacterium]|nr:polysaccharide biosynthesis/export family protein [Acidobacteriota bacterium]
MKAVNRLLAICVVLFLTNFTYVAAQVKTDEKAKETIENGKVAPETPVGNVGLKTSADSNIPVNTYKNQTGEKYRIGFQDTIQVDVNRHPELSQVVNINPDGTIRMPRINSPIIAVCKTENELSDTVTNYYKSYLKNPFVTVKIVQKMSQPYGVIGAVQKPGNFYLDRKISLLGLLTLAGGPNVEFAGSKIQIARIGGIIGCAETAEDVNAEEKIEFFGYNLNDVQQGKVNPLMQPGDIVSVLIAEEAYVVGNVVKPTKIILNEPKTLTQALAAANGTDKTANTEKVIIQRHDPVTGIKKELVFNLKDIRDQKIPDPQLQANDIVQVSNDKIKGFIKGVTNIITNTLPQTITRVP